MTDAFLLGGLVRLFWLERLIESTVQLGLSLIGNCSRIFLTCGLLFGFFNPRVVSCWQEEARREADDAHRAFAAYEGDLPTLLRVYEAFRKVGRGRPACAQRAMQSPRT